MVLINIIAQGNEIYSGHFKNQKVSCRNCFFPNSFHIFTWITEGYDIQNISYYSLQINLDLSKDSNPIPIGSILW